MALPMTSKYKNNTLPRVDQDFFNTVDYLITYINVGTGALTGAALVGITDTGGFFTSTNVEGALQELGASIGGTTSLNDLSDVTITSPTTGDTLVYNSGTLQWVNGSGFVTLTGVQTLSNKTFLAPSLPLAPVNKFNITAEAINGGGGLTLYDLSDIGKQATFSLTNLFSDSGGFVCPYKLPQAFAPLFGVTLLGDNTFQTITNKNIDGVSNSFSNIPLGSAVTGVLSVAHGGLGTSVVGAAGTVLTSDGTTISYAPPTVPPTLVAGANITLTPGTGTITIAAANGAGLHSITQNSRPGSPVAGDVVYYTTNIGPSVPYGSGSFNTISEIFDGTAWHPLGLYFG